jgi:hypothetical protein
MLFGALQGVTMNVTSFPTIELHVHLEGAVRPKDLLEVASRHGVVLRADDEATLQAPSRHFAGPRTRLITGRDLVPVTPERLRERPVVSTDLSCLWCEIRGAPNGDSKNP